MSLVVLVPISIIAAASVWFIWALNEPDRDARDAAKDSARIKFQRYEFGVNRAVISGDRAAVDDSVASSNATVLNSDIQGSAIAMKIAVVGSVNNGGGFNARSATAIGCAEMNAQLGQQPTWRAIPCPKDMASTLNMTGRFYEVTLSVTP